MTVMAGLAASRDYAETYLAEDAPLAAARARAAELGCSPIGTGGGAALQFLAAVLDARAVVEIGTGTGVSGLWLLRGMRPDGILTTIDVEAEHQRMARRIFLEAGYQPSRTRLITGRALDVLPRLSDPAARDPQTVALRGLVRALREAEEWLPALIPVGDGLLAAVKR